MSNFEARRYFHFWFVRAEMTVHFLDMAITSHKLITDPHLVLDFFLGKVHSYSLAEARSTMSHLQYMISE